ncbi:hypothetical protein [uncultured Aquimarina sp.]|uniref:hypothetical protein n=1 Tax=uncultured Aquimarina sp. TaxID=575652 RepID=UPI0026329D3D|nr:hypothetical protein [uncultured Aquimarina sp.]
MRNLLVFITFLSIVTMNAQDSKLLSPDTIVIGDVLTLGAPSGQAYQHIFFPRLNFIIKKGGTTNFKKLQGTKVVVTDKQATEGKTHITIKRKDGKKFLNSIAVVKVNLEAAAGAKEIL